MKINRADLKERIEEVIAEGAASMEEVDVTAEKVMKLIWPLIEYLKTEKQTA